MTRLLLAWRLSVSVLRKCADELSALLDSGREAETAPKQKLNCHACGYPLVCIICEAAEDARPEWQASRPGDTGTPGAQDVPSIHCPLCGIAVRQISSATLSLALWQHFNWMHSEAGTPGGSRGETEQIGAQNVVEWQGPGWCEDGVYRKTATLVQPHGSCLLCGHDKPFAVFVADASVGVCQSCREAAGGSRGGAPSA